MKYYQQEEVQRFHVPGGVSGFLRTLSPDTSIAYVQQDGRYPERGVAYNTLCAETLILTDGALQVIVDGVVHDLSQSGATITINPMERYVVVGKGVAIDVISPAWDKQQNHHEEE